MTSKSENSLTPPSPNILHNKDPDPHNYGIGSLCLKTELKSFLQMVSKKKPQFETFMATTITNSAPKNLSK